MFVKYLKYVKYEKSKICKIFIAFKMCAISRIDPIE